MSDFFFFLYLDARSTFQDRGKSSGASPEKGLTGQDWRGEKWPTGEGLKLADAKEDTAGLRSGSGNARYEKLNYNNSNNNNNNHLGRASGSTERGCKIEVVQSCRKVENSSATASGANNSNIITCGHLDRDMKNCAAAEGDTKQAVGDSSNNNKAMASPAPDNSCIVDNLVMETDKMAPSSGLDQNIQEQGNRSGFSGYGALNPEVNAVPQEMTFADPRQSQVFQMLTGLQQLRKDRMFTDITVRVKDVEFRYALCPILCPVSGLALSYPCLLLCPVSVLSLSYTCTVLCPTFLPPKTFDRQHKKLQIRQI